MNGIRLAEIWAEQVPDPPEQQVIVSELESRAAEIAAFLGIPEAAAIERLAKGFSYQHQRVNDDFRRCNPQTDEELLNWYRTTEEYIWELTAYHLDPGFNYAGMCSGIAERLKNEGVKAVLSLGDGIGDLTLTLHRAGFESVYHDLAQSRTELFAEHRFFEATGQEMYYDLTDEWEPEFGEMIYRKGRRSIEYGGPYDAVVSLDFMEHVTDVPRWAKAVYDLLRPGGLAVFQNAFDCGSGPDGAIPCHLKVNDKYAHAAAHTEGMALWDWLLTREIGFQQLGSNWYRKPV